MALLGGLEIYQQSASANKPHILGFNTARAAANDTLLEVWNGTVNTTRRFVVDLDGKMYSQALTAGDMLYAVTGGVSSVRRLDSLAIGTVGKFLRSSGSAPTWSTATIPDTAAAGDLLYGSATNVWTALAKGTARQVLQINAAGTLPEWTSALSITTLAASGLISANAGLTVAAAQTLTVTGATVTGLTAESVGAGTFPVGSFSISTLAVTSGLTLTGATITGTPTWSSTQSMNITGTAAGGTSGNAATATALQTARTINGVSFDGTTNITVTAAAGTLSGTTLAAGVTASSLTSLGTIASLVATTAAISGGTVTGLTSLGIRSTGAAFDLTIASAEVLTLGRTLTIGLNNAARTLTIAGDATISGTNTGDQTTISGNAGSATVLQTARAINGVSFDGSAAITITAAAGTLTGTTLNATVVTSSLTSVGTLTNLTVTNPISGSVTGSSGSTTGNAATATALATPRAINGVNFDGTAAITVTAAAGTLTGTTLNGTVVTSSLTSVGTLTSLTISASGSALSVTNSAAAGAVSTVTITNSGANTGFALDIVQATNTVAAIRLTDVTADATNKIAGLVLRHYTNSEEPVRLIQGVSDATTNGLRIGGGTASVNALTHVLFYLAANNTTVTGTLIQTITSAGVEISSGGLLVGAATGGNKGTGTINATAVYDDNVGPLTDYVFERYYGLTPKDRPDYELIPLAGLRAFTAKEYRLPMMPSRETFERERSLGRLVHGLWETTELHTTYLFDHDSRIAALEAENQRLQEALTARN